MIEAGSGSWSISYGSKQCFFVTASSQQSRIFFLIVLLCSSTILFVITYQNHWNSHASSLFALNPESTENFRDISNVLHAEEHNSRPPATIRHQWNITKGYRSPDGVRKLVYLINGQFPGPAIEARSGDTLEIIVSNQLEDEEGVAIHWHGLHMRGANEMDGVVGITQDAILAGKSFSYRFEISSTQAGTFWYHSHSELQRVDGLYGGLIIHKPLELMHEMNNYNYGQEQLLLIGDWYHGTAPDVQASYLTFTSSGHEPVPDSLLINGHGVFECSMTVPSRPVECDHVERPTLSLSHGKTRLRIVNVGSMAGFNISLPGGKMEAIQIDGGNEIISVTASEIGILYPGERVDVITSPNGVESLSISLDPELFTMQNPALTPTQKFPLITSSKKPSTLAISQYPVPRFDLSTALNSVLTLNPEPLPPKANQTILLYTHIEMLAHYDHVPIAYMNRTSWKSQSPPLLTLPASQWNEHQFVPDIVGNGGWVDIVVNNLDKDAGHPFHLHGHDFYILTRHAFPRRLGYRTYNPFDLPSDAATVYPAPNLINPPLKDTVHIPRRGYVILRIKADNLGIWFFHCHILWHAGTGMAMGFHVK